MHKVRYILTIITEDCPIKYLQALEVNYVIRTNGIEVRYVLKT